MAVRADVLSTYLLEYLHSENANFQRRCSVNGARDRIALFSSKILNASVDSQCVSLVTMRRANDSVRYE